jgi:transcriptional regulator with XRE-family HTH domain
MAHAADSDLDDDQSRAIAGRIREELARRNLSRQGLADAARISISTLEKALAGARPFTLGTLVKLERALEVSLRPTAPLAGQAPQGLGAYSRAAVDWLEGDYLTLRPSFEQADAVFAYRTSIFWDRAASCLAFTEAARQDSAFTQSGQVSLPSQSGHVHLFTNNHGQLRLITLGRATITGEMYGLLSTLQAGPGGHLFPIAAPIVFAPLRTRADARFGRVPPGEEPYDAYRTLLDRALREGFVRLVGGVA